MRMRENIPLSGKKSEFRFTHALQQEPTLARRPLLQSARKRAAGTRQGRGARRRHRLALHLLLTGAQPVTSPQRARETGQRPGTALGLRALLRFQMAAADDHLDQGQLALNRARHPLDQKHARRGRRIVDTLDCGALDARTLACGCGRSSSAPRWPSPP